MADKELKVKMSFDISNFEQGIKKMDQNMRLLDSRTKTSISSLENFGNKSDSLKTKADGLSSKIDIQKQKVKLLTEEYKKAVAEKGADSTATQKLEMKLNSATTSLNKMESQMKQLNSEIRNQPTLLSNMNKSLDSMGSKLTAFGSKVTSFGTALTMGITVPVVAMAKSCVDGIMSQIREETKLMTIMEQRMNATEEQMKSIVKLTDAQEQLGVVAGDVQVAGAQQVATFLKEAESVNVLIPSMNNLLAQQKGYNATTGDAVNVANMMGKVLEGQVGSLKRVGISFTEAEEKVLKYGNEAERVAMLAQVINNNVGQMNKSLAQTSEGKITQLKNVFGAFQDEIGKQLLPVIDKVVPKITDMITGFIALDDSAKANIVSVSGLVAMIPPAIMGFGKITEITGTVTSGMTNISNTFKRGSKNVLNFSKDFGNSFGSKLQSSTSKAFQGINNITGGGIDKITNSVANMSGKIKAPISNFVNNVKLPISKMTISQEFDKVINPMFGKFQNVFSKLGVIGQKGFSTITKISSIAMKMVAPIAIIGLLLAGLGLAQQNFGEQINQFATFATEKAPAIIQGFITGIVNKLPALIDSGVQLLLTLVDTIIVNLPIVVQGAMKIISALATGVLDNLDQIIGAILSLVETVLMTIIESLPMLLETGLKIILGLVEGISNNIEKIIDMIMKVILSLVTTIIENLPMIIEVGIKILVALINGLSKAIPKLIEYLPQIIEAIFNAFKEIDWKELGKNIITGLVEGLKALGNLVWDTLKGIGQQALNGFKKMFGINSPSTVFFGYGENIDEGLAGGVDNKANVVDKSLKGIKKLSDKAFESNYDYNLSSISPNKSGSRITNNSSNTNTNNSTINIIIEKVENYRDQNIKELVEEISFYLKKRKLATGGV